MALASPRGDVVESMKIGHLIRDLRFKTTAPFRFSENSQLVAIFGLEDEANSVCASSCFYIFVAGVHRWGNILGLHRPYLTKSDYATMEMDEAFEVDENLRNIVREYFSDMGVPSEYVVRSFEVPSGRIVWLPGEEIEERFAGYIPEIDEWISAKCDALTVAERELYDQYSETPGNQIPADVRPIVEVIYEKTREIDACKDEVHNEASCRAWESKYNRLNESPCDSQYGER